MTANPFDAIFSAPGASILGAMSEALMKARISGCDCESCALLRGAQSALDDVTRSPDADSH